EVRELLSRYFDTCRRLIELYGGTVEKFIGDAVMAVWGTPTATEDDAERAVRAALDLVAAVSSLGDEVGAPELAARAGVLTGEAAVTLGAEGQGMVAGDLVNTAARIQATAQPGTVYVGEPTKRASEPTIAYEDAGTHELKGKEEAVPLHRALRVVSGRQGALKSTGLEPPFVGRDRELRLVKELFHASADERTAHLVSAMGIAGIGKSRLAWEFYKYFDGLADTIYWHRGRCLAYGEGVTYWALADMVRMRARISEDDDDATARSKLEATLDEHILDSAERRFVEPMLTHLLAIGSEHEAHERHDLFAAWRLFFERLADVYPTVLVFEDMQWADESQLDFVEYLIDWSRSSPLFVLTLARPELMEKRPSWGAGHRNFTSLHLDPLSEGAMGELLDGFVPGLPAELREQILGRAEGVPLYAVETVRMLLDRGLLVQEGAVYRPTGEIPSLDVPETLHGLVASRLDALPDEERRLLQDGAVVGKTFTRQALAAVARLQEAELEPLLSSLVRKEVLGVQADPTSPEHGQYGFLQDLVRHVAYETLSRRERRTRHLAAAEYLSTSFAADEDEVVEVIASHYLAADAAVPDADDATETRGKAQATLVRAGERAESLAAAAEARRYFEQAAGLTADRSGRADLTARAGDMARHAGDADAARRMLEEAIELYEQEGDTHAAALASSRLAILERFTGRLDEALARLERAFEILSEDEPDNDLALVAGRLAMAYFTGGDRERATERAELALDLAEAYGHPEALATALGAKAFVAHGRGHMEETIALVKQQLAIALEHGLVERAGMSYFLLSDNAFHRDRYEDALGYLDDALALARRLGNRPNEWSILAESTYALFMLGRWDEALEVMAELTEEQARAGGMYLSLLTGPLEIYLNRGDLDEARRLFSQFSSIEDTTDVQERVCYFGAVAAIARTEGRARDALDAGLHFEDGIQTHGISHQAVEQGLVDALEAALELGDRARAEDLLGRLEAIPPGRRPPLLDAQMHRFRGRLGGDAAELEAAAQRFREIGIPFWLAVTLLEHGELSGNESSLEESREIFEQLDAAPWLERIDRARDTVGAPA
ncbi:MAG TPA: AAA family ATPase, partial [Gaiellaceae bacterium]|nr:AAA family ATPase [Gaiellaceae bacterium]